jgi:hypothetical protein
VLETSRPSATGKPLSFGWRNQPLDLKRFSVSPRFPREVCRHGIARIDVHNRKKLAELDLYSEQTESADTEVPRQGLAEEIQEGRILRWAKEAGCGMPGGPLRPSKASITGRNAEGRRVREAMVVAPGCASAGKLLGPRFFDAAACFEVPLACRIVQRRRDPYGSGFWANPPWGMR